MLNSIIYFFICIIIFYFLSSKGKLKISFKIAFFAFLLRCISGCIYGLITKSVYHGDTWHYFSLSLIETELFSKDTFQFIENALNPYYYFHNYEMSSGIESLQYGLFIKFLSVLNFFLEAIIILM